MDKNQRIKNYSHKLLPNKYLSDLDSAKENMTGQSIGYPSWNLLYYSLYCSLPVVEGKTITIIETGTNIGCSSIIMAQALKDRGYIGNLFTIEINKSFMEKAIENCKNAAVNDLITFINSESSKFLSSFVK